MDNKALPEQEDSTAPCQQQFPSRQQFRHARRQFETNDPGVHLDITDCVDQNAQEWIEGEEGPEGDPPSC